MWNISHENLGSHCFALLWLNPETFIIPVVVFLFCTYELSSSLFIHPMILREYLSAESGVMVFLASQLPTPCRTCWNSSEMVVVSLGRPSEPSISVVATMYASLYLRRYDLCPNYCLTIFSVIAFLTGLLLISPKLTRYHRCLNEEHSSGGNITFM